MPDADSILAVRKRQDVRRVSGHGLLRGYVLGVITATSMRGQTIRVVFYGRQ
jgi:hypothetical protein